MDCHRANDSLEVSLTAVVRFASLARLPLFVLATVIMGVVLAREGRVPTGDAPALLSRAHEIAATMTGGGFWSGFAAGVGQVVPQPPVGFFPAIFLYALGFSTVVPRLVGAGALVVVWIGMMWTVRRGQDRIAMAPLGAGGMMLATPMVWSAVEHVQWDLLCAAMVLASLGALVQSNQLKDRRWAGLAGGLAGLAALTKYNAPFFLILPILWMIGHALRQRRLVDALVLIGAGMLPIVVWLPLAWDALGPYLATSVGGVEGVDSASDVPSLWERLHPNVLVYYPAVLKDALGWPGAVLTVFGLWALRRHAGIVMWLAVVGGMLSLSLVGRREPRYLLPLLPVLFLVMEMGVAQLQQHWLRRGVGTVFAVVFGAQLVGTVSAYNHWDDPRPLAELGFGFENVTRFGNWPSPEPAFVPTSAASAEWKLAQAVDAIGDALGSQTEDATIGIMLYAHPRVPQEDLFVLAAAQRGWVWDRVLVEILAGSHAGPPPPNVQPGRVLGGAGPDPNAPRLPGQPPPRTPLEETFEIVTRSGPVAALVSEPQFHILYAVHPRGEPFYQAFFLQLNAKRVTSIALPRGFVGTVWALDDAVWSGPLGQQIQETLSVP